MAGPLERRHPLERDRVADVDVRGGDVDPELDAQGPTGRELALELPVGEHVDGVACQVVDEIGGGHGRPRS